MSTFIYGLCEPDTDYVRYVGKSDKPATRLAHHLCEARTNSENFHRLQWLRSILEAGQLPVVIILEECLDDVWEEREQWWIDIYRESGYELVNSTRGGLGGRESGWKHSDETRMKIADAAKKRMSDNRERDQQSDLMREWWKKNPDHVNSEEARAKQSESLKQTWVRRKAARKNES